jgi:hypothetical protein
MTYNQTKKQHKNQMLDTLVLGVQRLMKRRSTALVLTMTQLDKVLQNQLSSLPQNWPGSPSALRVSLNQVLNRLRNAGVKVRFYRSTNHTRTRLAMFSTR